MSNYSNNKKLILDYVNGDDTSVDVDILENDLDFMIAAIDYSSDVNLYKLCGDDIKYDYEMIKFLIKRFHDNHEFIIETTLDYLDNCDHANWYKGYMGNNFNDDDVEELEVLITIDKYLPQELDPRILEIKVRLKTAFSLFRIDLEVVKQKHPEEDLDALVGDGFEMVELIYPTSYIVKDYFAKSFLDELFNDEEEPLESKIHKLSTNKTVPDSSLSILIDLVKRKDMELANYIIARQDVFKDYLNRITSIKSNWENYETKILDEKIYSILDVIHNYYFENEHRLTMDEFDAIKYFANLLELTDRFRKLDSLTFETESIIFDSERINFNNQKMIKDLTPIIKNIMQGKNIYEAEEAAHATKTFRGKVVDSRKKYKITELKPKK